MYEYFDVGKCSREPCPFYIRTDAGNECPLIYGRRTEVTLVLVINYWQQNRMRYMDYKSLLANAK